MQDDDIVLIPLRARDGTVRAYAIVDAADADWVNQWRWYLTSEGYAMRTTFKGGVRVRFYLHRELLGLVKGDGMEGDHKDRDRLNDRRSNLRAIPKAGNRQNMSKRRGTSSRYRGVSLHKPSGRWVAYASVRGKKGYLGYFATEEEAAEVARAARARVLPFSTD